MSDSIFAVKGSTPIKLLTAPLNTVDTLGKTPKVITAGCHINGSALKSTVQMREILAKIRI
jgi:hypothetical protein